MINFWRTESRITKLFGGGGMIVTYRFMEEDMNTLERREVPETSAACSCICGCEASLVGWL